MKDRLKFRKMCMGKRTHTACSLSGKAKAGSHSARRRIVFGRLQSTQGSELLEFALSLPILLVVVIGIIDFARAYNTKHIMVNAARQAARIMASTPLTDSSCPSGWSPSSPGTGTPCAVQTTAISLSNYLTDAGLSNAVCLSTATPSYTSLDIWTYSCGGVTLVINKAYIVSGGANGGDVSSTLINLSYPYTFMFGRIIGLLVPGATGPVGTISLTSKATMQNLVLN